MTEEPFILPRYAMGNQQASAMLCKAGRPCSANDLLRAKREGVKAFRSSRVYFEESLFAWLDANPPEDEPPLNAPDEDALESKETLERRKLREQFLAARHRRLVDEGKYIALADFNAKATQSVTQFRASLNSLCVNAPQWSGLAAHEILRRVTQKTDDALHELESAFRKLANGG